MYNLPNNSSIKTIFVNKHSSLTKVIKNKLSNYSIVRMQQVHDNKYQEITDKDNNKNIPSVDALITTEKKVALVIKSADCLPILIYWQPKQLDIKLVNCKRKVINHENNSYQQHKNTNIICAIHAGRKGTKKQITTKVINYLKQKYSIDKHLGTLNVWFGPAICKECYQIDRKTNLHYDLVKENIKQIKQIFPEYKLNIINSNKCTLHENNDFYSYRKTGKGVKMNYSIIALK